MLPSATDPWFVYILQSEANGRLYTGMTNSPIRRLREHNTSNHRGARYTRTGRPWKMVYIETLDTKGDAMKREYRIKRLSRQQKLSLITKA
jgi:putative endonuclease